MIKVLMYHRVVDDRALSLSSWLCLHSSDFRRHLELIEKYGMTPVTLHDYRLSLQGELQLPRKPIIITFDDGYLDTYEVAYPILQEFGMKAVIFVLGDRNIKTNYWDERQGIAPAPLMEGHHIVELHAAGFEIGSHSMTHAKLTETTRDQMWDEISRSRMMLEILLNARVRSFSYPYGLVNSVVESVVIEAGYTNACAVYTGPPAFSDRPFEIRRIEMRNSTGPLAFSAQLLTPWPYYSWLRWKARLLLSRTMGSVWQSSRQILSERT